MPPLIRRVIAEHVLRLHLGRGLPEYFVQSRIAVELDCQGTLAVYERARACLGSHSATDDRLGMRRTTLYD